MHLPASCTADAYAECYPSYFTYAGTVVDSDDEEGDKRGDQVKNAGQKGGPACFWCRRGIGSKVCLHQVIAKHVWLVRMGAFDAPPATQSYFNAPARFFVGGGPVAPGLQHRGGVPRVSYREPQACGGGGRPQAQGAGAAQKAVGEREGRRGEWDMCNFHWLWA